MRKRKWVLTGGDTLAGQEVRDYIDEHHLPVVLLSTSSQPEDRVLTEREGELAVMEPLDAAAIEGAEALLLAATEAVNDRAFALAEAVSPKPALIDLTGQYESRPSARLRAPGVEPPPGDLSDPIEIVAHPAAIALAKLLKALHRFSPLTSVVANVFEPASSGGKEAIDELHKQTVSLLNFTQQPRSVYDAQVSFNLLPRFGDHAHRPSLESVERRMEQHLASLLAPSGLPAVSLRVFQAPVFHGHCQSVWVEFSERHEAGAIEVALKHAGVEVRRRSEEPASNVAAVGHSGIMVSDVTQDRSNARAAWIWLASDNMRTLAETAILLAGLSHREDA
jgi:aspartate-semialdehyde dehydrogenase